MDEYKNDLQIFLAEAEELLANTEENLVELEKSPQDIAIVQEVFRAMHTIKGGAAMLGLAAGEKVAHAMEDLLDEVRSGARELASEMVDVVFHVLDWLREWKAAVAAGSPEPDPGPVLARLAAFGDDSGANDREAEGTASDSEDLESRLAAAQEEGKTVYVLRVQFLPETPLLSVRCFQVLRLLHDECEVLGSEPSEDKIERDEVGSTLKVYFTADDDGRRAVEISRSVPEVSDVAVQRYESGTSSRSDATGTGPAQDRVRKTALGKTVRVDVGLLDFLMNMVGELVIDRTRLTQIAMRLQQDAETSAIGTEIAGLAAHLQRTSAELQEGIMRARLLPLRNILTKFPRMVRDLAQRCGKKVDFQVYGEDTELDRTVLEAIDDPLIHILRNAVDHGIELPQERLKKGKPETGLIKLSAWHEESQVVVRVEDDGAGIDLEKVRNTAVKRGIVTPEEAQEMEERDVLELVFRPGFSTAEVATAISGRGVGMDVVRANLDKINGHVEVRTKQGFGTTVTLKLPLTLAIMRALLVRAGEWTYAVPTSSVEEVVSFTSDQVKTVKGRSAMTVRGRVFPLLSLESVLRGSFWDNEPRSHYALLTRKGEEFLAIAVDELVGEEEVVVKELGSLLSRLPGIAGATILAHGEPAVILDIAGLVT